MTRLPFPAVTLGADLVLDTPGVILLAVGLAALALALLLGRRR